MVASIDGPQSVKAQLHFCGREAVMGSSASSLALCALHFTRLGPQPAQHRARHRKMVFSYASQVPGSEPGKFSYV